MTVRKAEIKDAERVEALLKTIATLHHNGRPDIYEDNAKYNLLDVEKMIEDINKNIFVAVNDSDFVMGYVICYTLEREFHNNDGKKNTLYVDDLCVDESFRHQSIGKELLNKASEYAKAQGCYNLELNVWSFNENAVKFYESCGMKEQRRRMEIIL